MWKVEDGNITIRLLKVEDKAVVEISDMGVGIEDANLKKIFSPFYTTKNGESLIQKKRSYSNER
ncbi:ATP-binding protein [Bacillus sp. UNC41MFS5]|uniref:ATP-binding protein n=1 Tax=Bacillus sp. UNC41MFS5 TaxID=1449046 RepID=UPI00047DBE9B|nr:ATP-binding protein [Bacillus sp. UNC41MFS5]